MKRTRPRLELLEDRSLLATLLWNPTAPGPNLTWSMPNNWIDLDPGPNLGQRATAAPQAGDTLVFSMASSASSTDNIALGAGQSFAGIKIMSGFTRTIAMQDNLTTQTFTFASNATITSNDLVTGDSYDTNFTLTGQGTWSEGTMSGAGTRL